MMMVGVAEKVDSNTKLGGGGGGDSSAPSSLLPIRWTDFQHYQKELAESRSPGSLPSSPSPPEAHNVPSAAVPGVPGVNNENANTSRRAVPVPAVTVLGSNNGVPNILRQQRYPNQFRNSNAIGQQHQHPKRGRGRPKGSKNIPKKQGLVVPLAKKIRRKGKTTNYSALPRFNFKKHVFVGPPPIVDIAPSPPQPLPQACAAYVEEGDPPPLPLQLPPLPLGFQFSWNSIPEQSNGGGASFNNLLKDMLLVPNQCPQFSVLPNPPPPALYDYDCSHLYEKYIQTMGKYYYLKGSATDSLLAFQEMCRLFVQDPIQLEQVNRFVSFRMLGMFNQISPAMSCPRESNVDVEPVECEVATSSPSIVFPSAVNISEDTFAEIGNGGAAANSNFFNGLDSQDCTSCDVNGMVPASLDETVKKRLSNDPERFDQYVAITANFTEFLKRLGTTAPHLQLQAADERQRVLERYLELLKNEPDLLDVFRHLFLTNGYVHSAVDLSVNNSDPDINSSSQQENHVVADEVQVPETEAVFANDNDTSRSQDQDDMESDPTPLELSSAPLMPDLRCHESAAGEMLLIDRAVLIRRIKDYPSLFEYCPSTFNKENDFTQMLDDRVNAILAEDLDQDKWKRATLDTLSYVFERAPSFRDPIEELLGSKGPNTANGVPSTPFCAQISADFLMLSLASFDGSYKRCSLSKDSPSCSGRTGLENEVLNDEFQFRIKSSAALFKRPYRTEAELILDTVEDARFEVDMMLYGIESTIAALEYVLKEMLSMSQAELDSYQMGDCDEKEPVAYKKSIEWFYNGERVMLGLRAFPTLFVPGVLETLKMKNKEWVRMRSKWNAIFETEMERVEVKND